MHTAKIGERMDTAPYIKDLDFTPFRMRASTERYWSVEFHEREREKLWMRVWQTVGRAEDIPEAGDWMEYKLFDQSYVVVRGRDGVCVGACVQARAMPAVAARQAVCRGVGHVRQGSGAASGAGDRWRRSGRWAAVDWAR